MTQSEGAVNSPPFLFPVVSGLSLKNELCGFVCFVLTKPNKPNKYRPAVPSGHLGWRVIKGKPLCRARPQCIAHLPGTWEERLLVHTASMLE